MSAKQHATKVGDEYQLSAALSFLMIGMYAYEDFDTKKPDKPSVLRTIVDRVMAAATAGGFARADIFRTLLAKQEQSQRMIQLAQEAVDCMGGDSELFAYIDQAREDWKGGPT